MLSSIYRGVILYPSISGRRIITESDLNVLSNNYIGYILCCHMFHANPMGLPYFFKNINFYITQIYQFWYEPVSNLQHLVKDVVYNSELQCLIT